MNIKNAEKVVRFFLPVQHVVLGYEVPHLQIDPSTQKVYIHYVTVHELKEFSEAFDVGLPYSTFFDYLWTDVTVNEQGHGFFC